MNYKIVTEKNPFFDIKKIPVGYTRMPAMRGYAVIGDDEYEIDKAEVTVSTKKDKEKFIKIYPSVLGEIIDLSKRSQRLINAFIEVYMKTQKTYDESIVIFNQKRALKYAGYDQPKCEYYLALKELTEKSFISKAEEQYHWFLNPHKFFIGDRLKRAE